MAFRVDSYKFLPMSMRDDFASFPDQRYPVSATQPAVPLSQAKVALLTSAGIYLKEKQRPFDIDRERRDPLWGDPSFRVIPRHVRPEELDVAHLHINPDDILEDFNVALPLQVFARLEEEREFGELSERNYSFMGYQGSTRDWEEVQGPELVEHLREDDVNLLVLAPA